MKKLLLIIVSVGLFSATGFCQEIEKWDLEKLVQHALTNRDDIAAQQEKIHQAENKVKEAFSHYFPRINLLAAYTQADSDISLDLSETTVETQVNAQITGTAGPFPINAAVNVPVEVALPDDITLIEDNYGNLSVTLDQPLFTWGRITNYVKAAKKLKEYENSKKTEVEVETVFQVRKAYFSFLVAHAAKRYANRLFYEVKTLRRVMGTLREKGQDEKDSAITELDLMEIDAFVLRAQSLKLNTAQMERTALYYLTFTSGLQEQLSPQQVAGELQLDFPFPPKDEYIQKGLSTHPLLASIESGIQAHEFLYKAEKASRWPTVGLRGFYEKLGYHTVFRPEDYYGVSLIVSGPIFDFGETKAKADQYFFKQKELTHQKKLARKYIETMVAMRYDEISGLKEELEITQQEMEIQDKRLKLSLFGMKNGLVSYRDYKDAFIARNLLKKEYFEKLADYYNKVNELIKMVGDNKV